MDKTPRESTLVRRTKALLKERGAWAFKVPGSAKRRGIPDLIACYRGIFVALEAKRPGKDATRRQRYELKLISRSGGKTAVVHTLQEVIDVLDEVDREMA